jgi:hypothetical protein
MQLFGKKIAPMVMKNILHRMILLWYFSHRYLFFILLLVTVSSGLWFWKQTVYQYHWSDAQKRAYLNEHAKETSFKEEKFRNALEEAHLREQSFQEKQEFRDIFY